MTFVKNDPALAQRIDWLRTPDWFTDVPDADLYTLAQASRTLVFAPGDAIFGENEPARQCLLVHRGAIRGLRYTADGDEKIFGRVGAGGLVSVLSLFMQEPAHLHTIEGAEDGEGVLLDGAVLRQLCLAYGALASRLLTFGANLVRHHTDQIDWITSSSAEARLAEYVLRVAQPRENAPLHLPLTRGQIAVKLGMRPETLSRVLAKWRRDGILDDARAAPHVRKLDALKRVAEGG